MFYVYHIKLLTIMILKLTGMVFSSTSFILARFYSAGWSFPYPFLSLNLRGISGLGASSFPPSRRSQGCNLIVWHLELKLSTIF